MTEVTTELTEALSISSCSLFYPHIDENKLDFSVAISKYQIKRPTLVMILVPIVSLDMPGLMLVTFG